MWQPGRAGDFRGNTYRYVLGGVALLLTWNYGIVVGYTIMQSEKLKKKSASLWFHHGPFNKLVMRLTVNGKSSFARNVHPCSRIPFSVLLLFSWVSLTLSNFSASTAAALRIRSPAFFSADAEPCGPLRSSLLTLSPCYSRPGSACYPSLFGASLVAQDLPAVPETWVRSLGEDPWRRKWQPPTPGFLSWLLTLTRVSPC